MTTNILQDFSRTSGLSNELIAKYSDLLPPVILNIWKEYGLGSFMDGYLKIINPDEYIPLIQESYFLADVAIPFMATAFGDIITWEKNQFVGIVQYRYNCNDVMIRSPELFLMLLGDKSFTDHFFSVELYQKAMQKCGKLAYDECFAFVPLLALGGTETVDNLRIAKIREHISMITALTGGV